MYYMLAAPARAGDCYCSCTQAQAEHADLREARAHAVVRVLGVKVAAAVANTNRLELVVLDLDCAGHELAAQVRARRCRAALSQLLAGILEAVLPLLALVSDAPVVTFAGAFPAVEGADARCERFVPDVPSGPSVPRESFQRTPWSRTEAGIRLPLLP